MFDTQRNLAAMVYHEIAVSSERLADWITFAGPANAPLACAEQALDAWWQSVAPETSGRAAG